MKKIIILFVFMTFAFGQFSARAGMILPTAEGAHNLIAVGAGYTFIHDKQMPVLGIFEYSFPTESDLDLYVIEAGIGAMYGFTDQIFAVASFMYSFEDVHGHTHDEFVFIAGAAYEFKNHLGAEILYGINGELKGPRFGLTYHF